MSIVHFRRPREESVALVTEGPLKKHRSDPPRPIRCLEKCIVSGNEWVDRIAKACQFKDVSGAAHTLDFFQFQLRNYASRFSTDDNKLSVSLELNNTELSYICFIAEKVSTLFNVYAGPGVVSAGVTPTSWLAAVHMIFVSMLYADSLSMMMLRTGYYSSKAYVNPTVFAKIVVDLSWKFGAEFVSFQYSGQPNLEVNYDTYF